MPKLKALPKPKSESKVLPRMTPPDYTGIIIATYKCDCGVYATFAPHCAGKPKK